ncbi:MAG TPA: tetratricopeptide repeat protein, partial [Anaerolineales bacterium]
MARKNNSEKKTAQDPRDAEAYYQRALSLIDEGQLQAAVEEFDRAIDLDPKHGQAFLQRGLALRKQGEIEKAVEDFTQAIETLTDSADKAAAHYNRSIAYSSQGEMEKAYADIDQATALNPQLATKYSVLGIANPHAEAV